MVFQKGSHKGKTYAGVSMISKRRERMTRTTMIIVQKRTLRMTMILPSYSYLYSEMIAIVNTVWRLGGGCCFTVPIVDIPLHLLIVIFHPCK